jgi:glycosyltransferase involved in cell wall biosynthesis
MAKQRPTVLQIVPELDVGGAERATVDIASALVEGGCRALVISSGGSMVEQLTRVGAEHFESKIGRKNPWYVWQNGKRLRQFIKSERVDLVHARSRVPAWSAYIATRKLRVPLVTTFHNAYSCSNSAKKVYNSVMVRGDRVIAISKFIAEHIRKIYGTPSERIALIPRGIDFSIFDPMLVGLERREQFRVRHKLRLSESLIIMPARLSPSKGHEFTLRALSMLREQPFRCLIIGPDQGRKAYRAHLIGLVERLGLQGKVDFVVRTDLPAAYAVADLVLHPSRKEEGFCRVAVEAQAMGVPVIASDIGALPETVLDGETGWLVPFGNARALAHAITLGLSLDVERRQFMAQLAMRHVRAHYDVRQMCASTLEVYANLLRTGDAA